MLCPLFRELRFLGKNKKFANCQWIISPSVWIQMFPGIIFHSLKKKNRKVLPYSMITLFVENFFVILKMILDRLDDIPLLNKRRPANLRNRSLINSTRFKNHLPNETPPMEMKKRRAHIAGDHASELFNPLPPPLYKRPPIRGGQQGWIMRVSRCITILH